jgi:integral membrane protein (TIGR01906 family)
MKRESKFFSALTSVALVLFLITGSVAVPILCRGFYYSQIQALELPRETGYSQEVIREAFDEVMDYLVKDAPFGTGELKWSESGRDHFADCRVLFQLDFRILEVSAALLAAVLLLTLAGKLRLHPFAGRGPCFWAFLGLGTAVLLLGIWAAVDFTSLFTTFHTLFFPGKSNWIFDHRTDQIILILPEAFWLRAAALAAGLAFGTGALLSVLEAVFRRARRPKSVYEQLKGIK